LLPDCPEDVGVAAIAIAIAARMLFKGGARGVLGCDGLHIALVSASLVNFPMITIDCLPCWHHCFSHKYHSIVSTKYHSSAAVHIPSHTSTTKVCHYIMHHSIVPTKYHSSVAVLIASHTSTTQV
jgi:hypothetical protein